MSATKPCPCSRCGRVEAAGLAGPAALCRRCSNLDRLPELTVVARPPSDAEAARTAEMLKAKLADTPRGPIMILPDSSPLDDLAGVRRDIDELASMVARLAAERDAIARLLAFPAPIETPASCSPLAVTAWQTFIPSLTDEGLTFTIEFHDSEAEAFAAIRRAAGLDPDAATTEERGDHHA